MITRAYFKNPKSVQTICPDTVFSHLCDDKTSKVGPTSVTWSEIRSCLILHSYRVSALRANKRLSIDRNAEKLQKAGDWLSS